MSSGRGAGEGNAADRPFPSPITHHLSPAFLALLALGLGNLMLAQDLAALNVALPSIERDMDVSLGDAQWVVNGYLLVYGMLIVTAGRLADELGRRRVFLIGGVIFAVASLLAGFAPHIGWLIAARALMGIGSGLMLPSATGMGYAVLPQRPELAGGLIVGAYGIGMALGPIVGGGLTEFFGWRWIQFINVPIAALVLFGVWRTVPADAGKDRQKIDYRGIATLSLGLVLLLLAFDQAGDWGWTDWRILLAFALSAALLAAFVLLERRAGPAALVPGDIVRIQGVRIACILKLLMAPAYAALVLYLPQILQKLMGFSPLETGVRMLPLLGAYAVVSFIIGPLTRHFDARFAIIGGMALMTLGPFLVSRFDIAAGYASLVAGMLAMGVGLGLFQPTVTTEAVKGDDKGRKSLAGGLVLMSQWIGGAIGLGLTTTIVASTERAAVDAHLAQGGAVLTAPDRGALDRMLAGAESAEQVLAQFDPGMARALIGIASDAFAAGVRLGLRVDSGIVAIGAVLSVVLLARARKAVARISEPSASSS